MAYIFMSQFSSSNCRVSALNINLVDWFSTSLSWRGDSRIQLYSSVWISCFLSIVCWKGYLFSNMFLSPLLKLSCSACVGLFLGRLFYCIDLCGCFQARQCCFGHHSCSMWLEVRYCDLPALVILFRIFWLVRVHCVSIWILGLLFLSLWRMPLEFWWELHWICRLLWEYGHAHSISFANLWPEAQLFIFWCLLPFLPLMLCTFALIDFSLFI